MLSLRAKKGASNIGAPFLHRFNIIVDEKIEKTIDKNKQT